METQSAPMQPQLRKYFYQKAAAMRTPISGTFELTPLCNMNCRMCYIRMTPEEMHQRGQLITADDWIEMGRACAEQGMLFLLITGGEPFLRKDFRYIYTELKKLGLMIAINSNATLIDEQTVAWLREDPPVKINVTLYGGSNDTYARLCGHPTGFDAATRAVDMLLEAGIMVNINQFDCLTTHIGKVNLLYRTPNAMCPKIALRSGTNIINPKFHDYFPPIYTGTILVASYH